MADFKVTGSGWFVIVGRSAITFVNRIRTDMIPRQSLIGHTGTFNVNKLRDVLCTGRSSNQTVVFDTFFERREPLKCFPFHEAPVSETIPDRLSSHCIGHRSLGGPMTGALGPSKRVEIALFDPGFIRDQELRAK